LLAQVDVVNGDVIRISMEAHEAALESPEGTVSAIPTDACLDPDTKWHRVERVREYSTRTLRMPETADLSSIDARMADGVLTVKVAKTTKPSLRSRRVEIS
jgi:HSP20 family molecular chaperone IbpA